MTADLLESHDGGVALLTFNRPDRLNAFSPAMLASLLEALPRLDRDPGVRAIVLTGSGRGFCAGGDVKRMAGAGDASTSMPAPDAQASSALDEDPVAALRRKMDVSRLLHRASKPTIAMVNGAAAGAGLSLALACDLRIAGESARFTTAFAKIGLPGDFGGSLFLTALVGAARARELYFTAELFDAPRALALGIVSQVVPDAALREVTLALARRLAHGPTLAYAMMKRNLDLARCGELEAVLDLEAEHQIAAGLTEDHREAARAFVDKRTPVFQGR